ncbi:hypothetical protein COO60DRAFT_20372 [Scenedesmus sp. NREL 46B-D3]|nr:hypothetical protein COO60DRAFT_20372 [Scenedesmus sp. NREL 46B-D3]
MQAAHTAGVCLVLFVPAWRVVRALQHACVLSTQRGGACWSNVHVRIGVDASSLVCFQSGDTPMVYGSCCSTRVCFAVCFACVSAAAPWLLALVGVQRVVGSVPRSHGRGYSSSVHAAVLRATYGNLCTYHTCTQPAVHVVFQYSKHKFIAVSAVTAL